MQKCVVRHTRHVDTYEQSTVALCTLPGVTMGLVLSIVTWVNQRFRGGYRRCLASSCSPTATVFYSIRVRLVNRELRNCNCSVLDTHFYMINMGRHSKTVTSTVTRYNRLAFGSVYLNRRRFAGQ